MPTKNGISAQFLKGGCLEPFQGKKADFLLCNPPYISQAEYATLHPEVKNFEPKMALCAGLKGSEFYARLATLLPLYLNPSAKLFFEDWIQPGRGCKNNFFSPPLERSHAGKRFGPDTHDTFRVFPLK